MDYLTHEEEITEMLNEPLRGGGVSYVNEFSGKEEDSLTAGRREIERAARAVEEAALNVVSSASRVAGTFPFRSSSFHSF